jgi:drug/metabolite transporter (DMT)-like permease
MQWLQMALLGFFGYTLANGALFWSMRFLTATTVSFLMGLVSITSLLGAAAIFKEIPNRFQFLGIVITLIGMMLFFQNGLRSGEPIGLAIFALALIGFTAFALLSRAFAAYNQLDTLTLTALPLALGGGLMLAIAIHFEGIPSASYKTWGTILFLAVINTALGYILYFSAIKFLQAFELNMILNLTPMWTAILGYLLLGEILIPLKWTGIVIVMIGMLIIQKETVTRRLSLH